MPQNLGFLHTDDFWKDYRVMTSRGVKVWETPRAELYGAVAVFEDLYGSKWDLLQLKTTENADGTQPNGGGS